MKKPFWKSRKNGWAIVDAVVSLVALWIAVLVPNENTANLIMLTVITLQPVVLLVVWGIATEDKAALLAGTHPSQLIHGDSMAGDKVGDDALSIENVYGDVVHK